ncbi:MAG TPA: nucleotidyltransferase domain-containing protein [Anaerolineales bacterium]|jgi:predicted nucleotidyltransferase|nr:nucleotidyltransferase domain-containing protein [Anaerolineales bacterium]
MPPKASSSSVKIISLDREKLLANLRRIADTIKREHPEVIEVRLFGSLARGDQTGTSDADILVLLDNTNENDPHRRILTFLPYFDLGRGVDLLVYTRNELEQRLSKGDRNLKRILTESLAL